MYRAVEATRDILPPESERWAYVEEAARRVFRRWGFREVRTPIFEHTELFKRSVGDTTDIVSKEMYTFTDRGDRSLTLRPEGTAPTVRAWIEAGPTPDDEVTRWYYSGPMFRYERKQKGRYRQFSQIGAEVIGGAGPDVDAEVLEMVMVWLGELGVSDIELRLNSIGCPGCRAGYVQTLRAALGDMEGWCADCQRRVRDNTLRVLDCKIDRERVQRLPAIVDHLDDACRAHFEGVRSALAEAQVRFVLDPHLVRGLDYYVRTTFEVTAGGLGAQNALLGGGRYDGLVAALGGPSRPGFGFALGVDRLVMILPAATGTPSGLELFIVTLGDAAQALGRRLASALRRAGMQVELALPGRSVKSGMRRADRVGARWALVIGDQEVDRGTGTLRRLADGHETGCPLQPVDGILEVVREQRS